MNVTDDDSYRFLVRAENSHGMSPPSSMTDRVRTLRPPRVSSSEADGASSEVDLDAVHDVLLNKVVELTSIEAIGSTMIRVTWRELMAESEFVEGYFVRFRDMSGGSQKFNMKTVMRGDNGNGGNSYVISNLRKFTEYEVRVHSLNK